jgi:hypothetical protein
VSGDSVSVQVEDGDGRQELLIGLAMLRQNWDRRQRTYLDSFIPFVVDCLRQAGNEGASELSIAEAVAERFGITVPIGALKTILKRTRRAGLAVASDGCHRATDEALELEPLTAVRDQEERKIRALSQRLRDFAQAEHSLGWSEAESDEALQYFVENWTASLDLIRSRIDGTAYEPQLVQHREADYVVSSFVLHLREFEPEPFDWFIDVIKGCMLSVGLYLDPGRLDQSLDRVTAYLDTPFLLGLIAGAPDSAVAADELLGMASELGMCMACFEHTAVEMQGVLEQRAGAIRRVEGARQADPGPTQISEDLSPSDLEDMAARLNDLLGKRGIRVTRKPVWDGGDLVDEGALHEALQSHVGYRSERAREKDVDSLVAVQRIRRGGTPTRIEDARAIFVTTNSHLVKASGRHFGTSQEPHTVPVALTSHELATILWLKSPTPRPDLPWKQVVADCRAAINPNDAVWSRYLEEVAVLEQREDVDPEMYYVARFSNEARATLMGRTHGDPNRLDARTVQEILEETRERLASPLRDELNAARRHKEQASEQLARERAARQDAEAASAGLVNRVQEVETEKADLVDRIGELEDQQDRSSRDLGDLRRALRIGIGVVAGLAAAAAVLLVAWVQPGLDELRHQVGLTLGGCIAAVSGAWAIAAPAHRKGALGVFIAATSTTVGGVLFL